ncbi:MAG: hypothetical protein RL748_4051 [Pseudomonadota bacterium]|jgi:predicted porin
MNNSLRPTMLALSLATIVMLPTSQALAQSNVTIYGRLDLGLRYSTNTTASGKSLTEIASGSASSSRWGIKGSEDLGGGLKALVLLEGGINPDTGTAAQSNRLFGRTSTVGLSGSFGTVTLGRQNSLGYDVSPLGDPFGWANLNDGGYFYDNYTSKRWDNSIKYVGKFGAFSPGVMWAFGEQASSARARRNTGVSLTYEDGPFSLGTVYQSTRNAAGVADRKAFILSGAYQVSAPVKLFLGYINQRSDASSQKNDVITSGLSYAATANIDLYGAYYHERQKNADGRKNLLAAMVNYKFSKRTNVYIQADRTNTDAGYASNVFDDQGFKLPAGITGRTTLTIGVRHQF